MMLLSIHSRLKNLLISDPTRKWVKVVLLDACGFFKPRICEQVGLGRDEAWSSLVRVLGRDVSRNSATFVNDEVAILSLNEQKNTP